MQKEEFEMSSEAELEVRNLLAIAVMGVDEDVRQTPTEKAMNIIEAAREQGLVIGKGLPADRKALSETLIGDTGVSVMQVIDALCDVLDGEQDHDIAGMVGEGYEEPIILARAGVRSIWMSK